MKLGTVTFVIASLVAAGLVHAGTPVGKKVAPVNVDSGVALHGYDPVTYFEKDKPEKGLEAYSYSWKGATWRFVSADDRKKFAQHPEMYAPQYGGYCAKAVSENHTADTDPFAYKIVDGKLYLNYDAKVQQLWEQDIPGRVANADKNWPELQQQ